VSGVLSTHVLDTTTGRPAAGIPVGLCRREGDAWTPVARTHTNADGRTDAPLLAGEALVAGTYELVFDLREHFAGTGFLGEVPLRFTVSDPDAHYHVPLLVTPWAYSTYRGS
jgi:5-hydroxyisourate hydrolase